jgi:hypothetical protein
MTPGQRSITMAGQDSKQAALQQLDSLSSRLKTSLSADQHRQVTDILQNLSAQSSTILANKALSRGQKDQQIEALSIAANARVLSVLTPEQRHMAKDLDQAADRFNGAPSGPCRGLEASVSCL